MHIKAGIATLLLIEHYQFRLYFTFDASLSNSVTSITEYLGGVCSSQVRIQRLARVIRAFKEAAALPLESYRRLWSVKGEIFEGPECGPTGRIRRLQRGRERIKQGSSEYDCAGRLSLMFLANDVDHLVTSNDLRLESGRGRKTAAFEKLATDSNTSLQSLKEDYKRSKNYFQLLAQAGPGSLLELGSDVTSSWEVKMNKEDITFVLGYRAAKLPKLAERARSLNEVAAHTIIDGLLAYGWAFSEILSSSGPLLEGVKAYLDLSKFSHDMTQMEQWVSSIHLETGADNADRSSKKRGAEDISVAGTKHKRRVTRTSKAHRSDQELFEQDGKTTKTYLNVNLETHPPTSCSSTSPSLSPLSRVIADECGLSSISEASAVDILDGGTISSTGREVENDNVDHWMEDYLGHSCDLASILKPSDLDGAWLAKFTYTDELQASSTSASDSDQRRVATIDPNMESNLSAADYLPILMESDTSRNMMLTMDPNMMNSLGEANFLSQYLDLEASNNSNVSGSTPGLGHSEHENFAHIGIMV